MAFPRTHLNRDTLVELLQLALPMVVSQGAFAVMVFCDRLFMSQIDAVHMASALGGGVASFFCVSLFVGILSYANALVAQYLGAEERHKCSLVVTQGLILSLLSVPLLAFATFKVGGLFAAMDHDPRQVVLERSYFFILMWGSLFNLIKICIASYFSGIGRTRVVMIADVLGVALNIPLSYCLIFGELGLPAMGIEGAAWGTVIASLFSLLLFIGFYLERGNCEAFTVLRSFHLTARSCLATCAWDSPLASNCL